ncbi:hypothetical protein [Blastococcus sp. CT_GayMR16]|uniref:hypothetical protein n=1 Tax=Blastococcus sp. CT_GayMR16 TaxID=2559607 RepID=UPI001073A41A|nr:hypothetical protein [Blastococcus sp. CT_GayMR16]TFV90426.1 hypothetical protein E4P38_03020 [Blastococcus sp. CT_GayMR16]
MTAVVGLDLSLTATGIATPDGVQTVGSKGKAGATLLQRSVRLHDLAMDIGAAVDGVASRHRGQRVLVVVEGPAFDSRTGHQHDRSGLWWLVVDELCGSSFADVVEVTTGGVKKYATGKGNAGKDEVLAAVVRRYPDVDVTNNNEADALVLRAMGCDHLGQPLAVVPQSHRASLDKVAWPDIARSRP